MEEIILYEAQPDPRQQRIIKRGDPDYPRSLSEFQPPAGYYSSDGRWYPSEPIPGILMVRGEFIQSTRSRIAIIGGRHPTYAGVRAAYRLGKLLAEMGNSVVSGLALGIDTAAHHGAIYNGGITYAVLGGPIDSVYPSANAELANDIPYYCAVLTCYDSIHGSNFPKRTQIIVGMSDLVIVVEGGRGSGTHGAALFAQASGKQLMVIRSTTITGEKAFLQNEMLTWPGVIGLESPEQLREFLS